MAQTKEGAIKAGAKRLGVSIEEYKLHIKKKEKWCTTCKSWNKYSFFAKGLGSYGLASQCKKCQSEYGKRHHIPIPKHLRKKPGVPRKNQVDKFWENVTKTNGCWLWEGHTSHNGYGRLHIYINDKRKIVPAHRLSWEIHNGPVPKGILVLHKCDNPPCVNPDHLFLGTNKDNTQDSLMKGRACLTNCKPQKGEKNGSAILNENMVESVRYQRKNYNYTFKELAGLFNISPSQIANIIHGRSWRNI